MPGTANRSASFWGQVVAIPSSARSPKTRNAGIFLCFATPLNRQARKACSIRICGCPSDLAAPLSACLDCVRAVALGDALDLLEFFFRLRLGTGRPASFMTKRSGMVSSTFRPAGVRRTVPVGNLFALFLEHSICKGKEFCAGHGSQNFLEVVSADLVSWKKLGV